MTIRIFRDSINPGSIPLGNGDGVMAYANGKYAWPPAAAQQFIRWGKQVVHIDVDGSAPHAASILDVERYDATPAIAADWIQQRNMYRQDATIYIERAALDALFAVTDGLPYWLIVADWTGSPHEITMPLPKGVRMAGTQFASLGIFDSTAIYADGWHPVLHRDWIPV